MNEFFSVKTKFQLNYARAKITKIETGLLSWLTVFDYNIRHFINGWTGPDCSGYAA